ncbi:kinase-like protein [Amniculicola lignicola CBS 123094]|uniref:Kinase-like protein n=1 Tax=Amniculicola lignicola CBS 123094 TaxID=1392246 RepID=A0A6A5WI21_9PLEO|nr:kinase-like protein [Amniculicola lignicola CBS 123094]
MFPYPSVANQLQRAAGESTQFNAVSQSYSQLYNHPSSPTERHTISDASESSLNSIQNYMTDMIQRANFNTTYDYFGSKEAFPEFKKQQSAQTFFCTGKAFRAIWPRIPGTGYPVQRFVVIKEGSDSCECLRLRTYGGHGVGRPGTVKRHHAIVYTGDIPPAPLLNELPDRHEIGMVDSVRVKPLRPWESLDPSTRINLRTTYTVAHDLRVAEIGDVAEGYLWKLIHNFHALRGISSSDGKVIHRVPLVHHEIQRELEDPYRFIALLGRGSFGHVDQVEGRFKNNAVFARKLIRLPIALHKRATAIENIKKEARIMDSLRHHHIVTVVETYEWRQYFGIIMLPIAESDLATTLDNIDSAVGKEREELLRPLPGWCACLIHTIHYIHENIVRHKDIKPHNILIKDGKVLLTDFGLAEDMKGEDETGTDGSVGLHTARYSAPEVRKDSTRRGRSADIFSLGCVLLELATVTILSPGARSSLRNYHGQNGSTSYSDSPSFIANWILHLAFTSLSRALELTPDPPPELSRTVDQEESIDVPLLRKIMLYGACDQNNVWNIKLKQVYTGLLISDLVLLMMNPEPVERATAQQLVRIIDAPKFDYNFFIHAKSCTNCQVRQHTEDLRISNRTGIQYRRWWAPKRFVTDPEKILGENLLKDWNEAKELWIRYRDEPE